MIMKKILLSTASFPNLEYFAVIAAAEEVWLEASETYARQSYRNRYYIAGPENRQMLVVPVIRPQGNHTPIQEVIPDSRVPWQRNHLRAIETAYNRSAYFLYYRDVTEALFNCQNLSLLQWNSRVLRHLLEILRIDAVIHHTEIFEEKPERFIDLRNDIHPKKEARLFKTSMEPYFQPFSPKYGFIANLSILDLIYNQGPHAGAYLKQLAQKISFQVEE
jgi:hypothetical protein